MGIIFNRNIVSLNSIELLFVEDSYNFPRPILAATVGSIYSSEELHLYNVHLKCCDGAINQERRATALSQIKEMLDLNYPSENIVVAGDFNENLSQDPQSIFFDFLGDINYHFTDLDIAYGDPSLWSYPSYPSHLDHILISNELFDNLTGVESVLLENCLENYLSDISDHRPLMISLLMK